MKRKEKKNYKDTIKIKIEAKELSFTQKLNKLKQRVLCKGRQTCRAATKKKMLWLRKKISGRGYAFIKKYIYK